MNHEPLLQVTQLSVTLSGKNVLRQLDFHVAGGEWLGLVGANGSGKSTLIRSLCGRLPVNSGCVTLGGRDLQNEPLAVKALLGVCLEPHALPDELRLRQFLELWAQARLGSSIPAQSVTLLKELQLEGESETPIGALSLGMRQKLSLVAALMGDAELLLLDESLSNLDPLSRLCIREHLLKRHQQGTAILYCAHEFAELERCCDRVLALEQGSFFAEWRREQWTSGQLEALFVAELLEYRKQGKNNGKT